MYSDDFLNLKKSHNSDQEESPRQQTTTTASGRVLKRTFDLALGSSWVANWRRQSSRRPQGELVAPMDQHGGIWIRAAVAVAAGGAIAARAVRRKSVDSSAVFVGVPAMVAHTVAGYRFAGLLLVFFFTSSRVTRIGETRKRALDPEFKEGGQRNW
ncbi:hypothetical protein PR202_ga23280 [Eleusine coracana subsp. coracana]|uniref:Uncharacterized protein n=1 Tax=Eleusine coracana subsp. coracana TaxID=191504 RepID=A0AAV5D638_ELECO|nr:hypothetical protein PR202_ga23280 [Eleusine coracana subsp. coracana]